MKKMIFLFSIIVGLFFVYIGLVWQPIIKDSVWYAMLAHGYLPISQYLNYPPLFVDISRLFHNIGIEAYTACFLTGSIFYILTTVPLYFILKVYSDEIYSALGCLLYLISPQVILWCNVGLLESIRNFFLILGILFFILYYRSRKKYNLILLGFALGCLSLCRQEGVLYAFIFIIVFILINCKTFKLWGKERIIEVFILFTCIFIVITPRSIEVYKETGYFVPTAKQAIKIDKSIKKIKNLVFGSKTAIIENINGKNLEIYKTDNKISNSKQNKNLINDKEKQVLQVNPIAKNSKVRSLNRKFLSNRFLIVLKNFLDNGYSIYIILALIGVLKIFLAKKENYFCILILVLFFFNFVLFYFAGSSGPSTRRFVINVPLLMPFTMYGIKSYYDFLRKSIGYLAPLTLFVLLILSLFVSSIEVIAVRKKSINCISQLGTWIYMNKKVVAPEHENDKFTILTVSTGPFPIAYFGKSNYISIPRLYLLSNEMAIWSLGLSFQYYPKLNKENLKVNLIVISSTEYNNNVELIEKYEKDGLMSEIPLKSLKVNGYHFFMVNKNIRVRSLKFYEE